MISIIRNAIYTVDYVDQKLLRRLRPDASTAETDAEQTRWLARRLAGLAALWPPVHSG